MSRTVQATGYHLLRRALERALALPFASPNAFVASEAVSDEWSVRLAFRERRFGQIPGGSLVRIPDAV